MFVALYAIARVGEDEHFILAIGVCCCPRCWCPRESQKDRVCVRVCVCVCADTDALCALVACQDTRSVAGYVCLLGLLLIMCSGGLGSISKEKKQRQKGGLRFEMDLM